MKKQFAIKSVQNVKEIVVSAAKFESANILKFLADGPPCCSEWDLSPPVKSIVATR